jgi:hypothetical protein
LPDRGRAAFVSWRQHCPICRADCTQPRCEHEVSFVAEVAASEVTQAALGFLNSGDAAAVPAASLSA